MVYQVFAVFDSKAKAFMLPFFSPNVATGARLFESAANDPASLLGKFPEDYTLFHQGEFDDSTGQIKMLLQPVNMGLAANFRKESEA